MKTLFLPACSLLFLSLPSPAQDFIKAGTAEVGGGFGFSFQSPSRSGNYANESSLSTFILTPYIGVMLGKGFELGFEPIVIATTTSFYSNNRIGIFIAPAFNFPTKTNTYPFIEALIGYEFTTSGGDDRAIGMGVNAGLKVNVSGSALLLLQIEYLREDYLRNENGGSQYSNSLLAMNTIAFGVGFRVFFLAAAEKK